MSGLFLLRVEVMRLFLVFGFSQITTSSIIPLDSVLFEAS